MPPIAPLVLNTGMLGNVPLDGKIELAARHGFVGIEVWMHEVAPSLLSDADVREGRERFGFEIATRSLPPNEIAELARQRGISIEGLIPSTDILRRWSGRMDDGLIAALDATMSVAATLGGRYVILPTLSDAGSPPQIAQNLRELEPIARDHNIRLGLEPIGHIGMVRTVRDALAVLETAGLGDDAGIVLDAFHFFRARQTPADLAPLDPGNIAAVQINDALALPFATLVGNRHRDFPGRGVFDVNGFCDALLSLGYEDAFVVEVLNPEIASRPAEEVCHDAFATASAIVADATTRWRRNKAANAA